MPRKGIKVIYRKTPGRKRTVGPESGHPLVGLAPFSQDEIARFWAKVEQTDGCWLWRGAVAAKTGYGRFWLRDYVYFAHRIAYALTGKEVPLGLIVDHICRNPGCVRPDHLRVVDAHTSARENTESPIARNARKTHCIRGHPLEGMNVARVLNHITKNTRGNPTDRWAIHRYCLTCWPAYHDHPRRVFTMDQLGSEYLRIR